METYIQNELIISSDLTLEQAATHSAKLLTWLLDCQEQMQLEAQKQLELSYTDIECMFKATLYLHDCYVRYGEELVEAVLLQGNQAHAAIRSYYEHCERDRTECIKELCASIINGTCNGHAHAPLLYQMHKTYGELQPAWNIIKELDWSALGQSKDDTLNVASKGLNADVQQMRQLVRRIFQLATIEDIKTALQRALQLIRAEIWLQLFREPKDSILYTRCYILRQMICDMLVESTDCSAFSFVHNIYQFVAAGNSCNISRFYRWLLHVRFAGALGSYLLNYWTQQLPYLDVDELQLLALAPMAALPLDEVLYLTHLMLAAKSPCRGQFYAQLRPLPLLQRLLMLLNKIAYVY